MFNDKICITFILVFIIIKTQKKRISHFVRPIIENKNILGLNEDVVFQKLIEFYLYK